MVHGFIAYDCNGPKLNITAFNSLSMDPCVAPLKINNQSTQRIQLLQKTDTYQIPCSIIINYFIKKKKKTELVNAQCSELHQRSTYHLPNGGIITDY